MAPRKMTDREALFFLSIFFPPLLLVWLAVMIADASEAVYNWVLRKCWRR